MRASLCLPFLSVNYFIYKTNLRCGVLGFWGLAAVSAVATLATVVASIAAVLIVAAHRLAHRAARALAPASLIRVAARSLVVLCRRAAPSWQRCISYLSLSSGGGLTD